VFNRVPRQAQTFASGRQTGRNLILYKVQKDTLGSENGRDFGAKRGKNHGKNSTFVYSCSFWLTGSSFDAIMV
jgi:hypothetical protein